MEATRIRLVSQRNYASGLVTGFTRLTREEGIRGLYAGFLPILCKFVSVPCSVCSLGTALRNDGIFFRQIPYAIGQFTVNELCHEIVFRSMSEETRRSLTSTSKLTISLGSGIIAGFAAAILSQVSGLGAIRIWILGASRPDTLFDIDFLGIHSQQIHSFLRLTRVTGRRVRWRID